MISSVSSDGFEWSLDLRPDSLTLTLKDLVQELTMSSQEFPLATRSLLLSQRQQFLNNHLARVPVNPNQQGTHEIHNSCVFSIKKLQTTVKNLRAITMRSTLNPDCGYDNSTIILIGDVYCPNTKCSGKLCLHNKTLQTLGGSDYQCPQCGSVCQVRNIAFEDQTNSFFLSPGQGFTFLKKL